MTLKNEFQETTLAATLNFGAASTTDEKTSLVPEHETDEIMEIKEVDDPHEMGHNEFSPYRSDCPTSAY